jgi:hypothetical protein
MSAWKTAFGVVICDHYRHSGAARFRIFEYETTPRPSVKKPVTVVRGKQAPAPGHPFSSRFG